MDTERLPVVIGAGGGGGGKGGGSGGGARTPQESPDSLRSTQFARVINLIGEGEFEGFVNGWQSVFVDDTPLQNPDGTFNFVGAAIEWRSGTPVQAPINGFSEVESEQSVGITVTVHAPVVRSVTNPNLDAVRLTIGFPSLSSTDVGTGDVTGATVQLAIDLQREGGGWQQVWIDTVSGKTTSRYQRSYRIQLARFGGGGSYDFRIRRLTPDSNTVYLVDSFQWESITEIVQSNLMYSNSAICGVQIDASTFRQIPKLAFDMRMRRVQVPSNYDPWTRAYYGFWAGDFKVAWTDNPAWVLYDLITTSRFGLGDYVSPAMIDKWTLYSIGQYCDGMVPNGFGGWEPRYTCNIYLQSREEAISLVQNLASIFNGIVFWSAGQMIIGADIPGEPVMTFTPANVIDGRFTYQGTPLNQRHTVALVTWSNPANRYEQEIEYVEDRDGIDKWGLREISVVATGCTSRGQAARTGRWILLTEQMLSETVTFKTSINGAFARPGDVFYTADPVRAGFRNGGRVLNATATWLQLDSPVEFLPGVSYSITLLLPDGSMQRVGILNPMATTDSVWLTSALRALPDRLAMWALSANVAENEQWRCVSCTEDDEGNVEMQGVAYRPDKFAAIEHNLRLQPIPTGILNPFFVGPPTELRVMESLYQVNPVVVAARATFSWLAPVGAVRFEISHQFQDDTPVFTQSFMSSIDIQPTRAGTWFFTVVAVNSLGIRSVASALTVEIVALNRPPEDMQDFQLDIINDAAQLRWRPAENLDVIVGGQVVIRYSSRMSTEVMWEEATEIMRFAGAQSNGFVPLMRGTYLGRFMNSSGRLSENTAYIISTVGTLRDYNVVATFDQPPLWEGVRVNTTVRYGVLYIAQDENDYAVSTEAGYYFDPDPALDMGQVYTVKCQAMLEGAVYGLFDSVDRWPDWDARLDVDGERIDEGGGQIVVSMTNVKPEEAGDEDWSPWKRLISADLTFRAARFALLISVKDRSWGMGITDCGVEVDVPDRIESRNNIPVPVGGADVTFTVPFMQTPAINIIAQGLSTGDYWEITQQSRTGFHIAFYAAGGNPVARTADWIARGYGYEHQQLNGMGYRALIGGSTAQLRAQRIALTNAPKGVN
ncbi:host specificity protein J [Paraburkholderia adhaesiva]|uniref:host specificity protein J n=1 Tax=Paraburkholderia adhaesiva TaxID=2883244 RepID=UPI001F1DA1D6|nr:phage tail protein [Paraburkholderia adhaesiva]